MGKLEDLQKLIEAASKAASTVTEAATNAKKTSVAAAIANSTIKPKPIEEPVNTPRQLTKEEIGKAELDRLIEAALADNKLTTKEMEVLVKKAKQLGIDEDEFIIELEAKEHHSQAANRNKKKGSKIILLILSILVIIVFAVIAFFVFIPSKSEKLETALSNYDFKTAYSLISKFSGSNPNSPEFSERALRTQQIIKTAVPFYLKNNQPQLAIDALSEYQFELTVKPHKNFFYYNAERQAYNKEAQFFNSLWFDIAYYLVKNGQVEEGVELVKFKLVPYSDDDSNPTYQPIQELKNGFQEFVKNLPKN